MLEESSQQLVLFGSSDCKVLPSKHASNLASGYASTATDAHKKELGQFFTPQEIGAYLASLCTVSSSEVHLLDPGFGTGVLACALVERLVETSPQLTTVYLDAYDVDPGVEPYAQASLSYLANWLTNQGIALRPRLVMQDFILEHRQLWNAPPAEACPLYDVVISNPPYFKLGRDDDRNTLARQHEQEQPNIYALFIVQAALLTKQGGQLIFIIPRSFCSGPYFERFRAFLYQHLRLDVFHLFHSRSKAFEKDAVLQENMIFQATRLDHAGEEDYPVQVLASEAGHDMHETTVQVCTLDELVDLGSQEKVLFLPTNDAERALIADFKLWRHRLRDFGIEVSTGPVVAFRVTEHLAEQPAPGYVPLLWIDHVRRGAIHWPNNRGRQQYIALVGGKRAGLLPNRNYVLLRRFSAKDDKHRLIAAPYYREDWAQYDGVGIENKLNYFYALKGELTREQVAGLTALLNSAPYDAFFRVFNGNTQVSATEARALPMPSLATIEEIGRQTQGKTLDEADDIVQQIIKQYRMTAAEFTLEPTLTPKQQKILESTQILKALGMPRAQLNDRSALTLLALLDLKPEGSWQQLKQPVIGVTPIMDWCKEHYQTTYAPNSRETFRRQTLHQFVSAGIADYNPDDRSRAVNSPKACYQVYDEVTNLLATFGTPEWKAALEAYLQNRPTLIQKNEKARDMMRIPLVTASGKEVKLSAGKHSQLIRDIIEVFGPYYAPGAEIIYIGDTKPQNEFFDRDRLAELGVTVDKHGKMPDVVLYYGEKDWLLLIESVTSHGPVDNKRHEELSHLFATVKDKLVFVSAFPDRKSMSKYRVDISWETEVWFADAPTHMLHFNGKRFLGPYKPEEGAAQ
ncbi:BsuBI/PstI family type II restriction endonuclease [Hymenobacter weizhouensis]|uniref:BsuBI/PstI family type II restriction endonuclease n=1 Tax=Hymenobacter sp. YIM 151500-1 TaxID=2987689 RepID=UPI0022272FED|nr:BsuBI/PstI family type II restriction endonuclease [Hymenobacter sp. YIM 151500-1]UYZ64895.1 BsuBI/PstI family type II restriction endonuclease [Hymenobacter sp. YIM 151500-1]